MKRIVLLAMFLPIFLGCSPAGKQGDWIISGDGVRVRVDDCKYETKDNSNVLSVTYSVENKSQVTHNLLWKTKRVEDTNGHRWEAVSGINAEVQPTETRQAEAQFEVPTESDLTKLTFGNATLIKVAGQGQDQGQVDANKPLAYRIKLNPTPQR